MKIKRPLYLDNINLISLILLPLSAITYFVNLIKKLSNKIVLRIGLILI